VKLQRDAVGKQLERPVSLALEVVGNRGTEAEDTGACQAGPRRRRHDDAGPKSEALRQSDQRALRLARRLELAAADCERVVACVLQPGIVSVARLCGVLNDESRVAGDKQAIGGSRPVLRDEAHEDRDFGAHALGCLLEQFDGAGGIAC